MEFGTLRPRKCDNKFCAFCKKSTKKFVKEERCDCFDGIMFLIIFLSRTDPKPILLKGLCKTATEEDFIFDTEFYPSGKQDGRIYFRWQEHTLKNAKFNSFCKSKLHFDC